jgi:hypothetical protein
VSIDHGLQDVLGEVVGREAELTELGGFVHELAAGPRALVLVGEAGAGKTTLFDSALQRAHDQGATVLVTRPSESDAPFAFAGLSDLLEARLDEVMDELPPPQRRALRVALLIEDAPDQPPERHAVAAAVRAVFQALSREKSVLVAIDDVQWLDGSTAEALAFTFRRLEHEPIGLLCAERTERSDRLPLGLERSGLETTLIPVGGLSIGALHHLLRTRIGMSFSRPTLGRIEAESGGNPFIALEMARALRRRGVVRVDSTAALLPATVGELVSERLQVLQPGTLDFLRVVALMADPDEEQALAVVEGGGGLDAAVSAGFIAVEGRRLRFTHPLLASAVASSIPPSRRRELHAALAATVSNPEERARHLALAAVGPSESTCAELESAARLAAARGAPASAGELLELARSFVGKGRSARRTISRSPERRLLRERCSRSWSSRCRPGPSAPMRWRDSRGAGRTTSKSRAGCSTRPSRKLETIRRGGPTSTSLARTSSPSAATGPRRSKRPGLRSRPRSAPATRPCWLRRSRRS